MNDLVYYDSRTHLTRTTHAVMLDGIGKMKQSAATCMAELEVMVDRGEILHSEVPLVSRRISELFSKWSKEQSQRFNYRSCGSRSR